MKKATTTLFITMVLFGFAIGCGKTEASVASKAAAKSSCATCAKGLAGETVWCDKCAKGFVDGKKTGCKSCFEGKSGNTTWCESCAKGFVNGKETKCKGCVDAALNNTECPACKEKGGDHKGHSHS